MRELKKVNNGIILDYSPIDKNNDISTVLELETSIDKLYNSFDKSASSLLNDIIIKDYSIYLYHKKDSDYTTTDDNSIIYHHVQLEF